MTQPSFCVPSSCADDSEFVSICSQKLYMFRITE